MRATLVQTKLNERRFPYLETKSSTNVPQVDNLGTPEKVFHLLNIMFSAKDLTEEHAWLIGTDTKLKVKGIFELSVGTINASLMSSRSIFMKLLLLDCAGFIIAHNHPSGDPTPSKADIETSTVIHEAAKILDIKFFDFVVIGNNYYSFRENNLLEGM